MTRWVEISLHKDSETRWIFVLDAGLEVLVDALGRTPTNRHWLPTPEDIRNHEAQRTDLFARVPDWFRVKDAQDAAAASGKGWSVGLRIRDAGTGQILREAA